MLTVSQQVAKEIRKAGQGSGCCGVFDIVGQKRRMWRVDQRLIYSTWGSDVTLEYRYRTGDIDLLRSWADALYAQLDALAYPPIFDFRSLEFKGKKVHICPYCGYTKQEDSFHCMSCGYTVNHPPKDYNPDFVKISPECTGKPGCYCWVK